MKIRIGGAYLQASPSCLRLDFEKESPPPPLFYHLFLGLMTVFKQSFSVFCKILMIFSFCNLYLVPFLVVACALLNFLSVVGYSADLKTKTELMN